MFPRHDYKPYIWGVVIFGGFFFLPITVGHTFFDRTSYAGCLLFSLLSCVFFISSQPKSGQFKLLRFLLASLFASVFFWGILAEAKSRGGTPPSATWVLGVLIGLGFPIMATSGWIGIALARFVRTTRWIRIIRRLAPTGQSPLVHTIENMLNASFNTTSDNPWDVFPKGVTSKLLIMGLVLAILFSFFGLHFSLPLIPTIFGISLALGVLPIVLWIIILRLGSQLVYRAHQRGRDQFAEDVLFNGHHDNQFTIFLRPFEFDGLYRVQVAQIEPPDKWHDLSPHGYLNVDETEGLGKFLMSAANGADLTLIGLGDHMVERQPLGFYSFGRMIIGDNQWKKRLESAMQRSAAIFIVPLDNPGTLWEIQTIKSYWEYMRKTLLIMPPRISNYLPDFWEGLRSYKQYVNQIETRWNASVATLHKLEIFLPAYDQKGGIFSVSKIGKNFHLHQITQLAPTCMANNYSLINHLKELRGLALLGKSHAAHYS